MKISIKESPLMALLHGDSSQSSNIGSGSQESLDAFSSQDMPSQTDSQNLINAFEDLINIPDEDNETTENNLKSSLGDNVSLPNFYTHSANSQESLQTPDITRSPAPVMESQPSVVPSWQPPVKPPVHRTSTKVKRGSLPIEKGPQQPKRKDSSKCTTVSSSEPFVGHRPLSKEVGRVKRGILALVTTPPTKRVRPNSVSSTVAYESESCSELSSLDLLDHHVSSTTSGFLPVISPRPNKQVKVESPITKAPITKAKASSMKSSKLSPPKTYIKSESSQPSRYSPSSSISSDRGRNASNSSGHITSRNASSTVDTKNVTKEEKEQREKKADKKARNREASQKLRDKRKAESVNAEMELEEWEKKNKALETDIEMLEASIAKWNKYLLQAGVTKKEIDKKLRLARMSE